MKAAKGARCATVPSVACTVVALALAALPMAGCGGGSGEKHAGDAGGASATSTAGSSSSKHASRKAARARKKAAARAKARQRREAKRRTLAKVNTAFARLTATAVAKQFGFAGATIAVSPDGTSVTIQVPAAKACKQGAEAESLIAARLRQVTALRRSHRVKRVRVVVAGTGQALGAYVSSHCGQSRLPAGSGHVVYAHSGTGFFSSPSLKIRGRRWRIEYYNGGSSLRVFPIKGNKPQGQLVNKLRPGVGSQTFHGPGTFTLRVVGAGAWRIRVRDAR
jgi:hypothetical protein